MKPKGTPSVVVCYYDPKYELEKQPKRVANRCIAEIVSLCKQFDTISNQLFLALRRKDIDEAVYMYEFHYENFIFRLYALQERVWDVLEALAGIQRKKETKWGFRKRVLSEIKQVYPEVYGVVSNLRRLIESDIKYRHVVTHETFLFLGLVFGVNFGDIYEISQVLTWEDPQSEGGRRIQKIVRKALREFAAENKKHIQEIITEAFNFTRRCSDAVNRKLW